MNALASAIDVRSRHTTAETVQAWSITRGAGIGGLALSLHARSDPGPGEVRVRMHAVSLNHRDLMIAKGLSGPLGRALVPASDGAGEVVAVGAGVNGLRVGDRVISSFYPDWVTGPATDARLAAALGGSSDGVLADEVLLPETAWVPLPPGFDYLEAATLTCAGVTAWNALFCADPLPIHASIGLLGTGGVSIWALQLAQAAGHRVIITSSDERKLARARQLGADATINYRDTPDWSAQMRRLTDGAGVDRVLDVGGPDTLAQSIAAVRTGGAVAVVGRLTGNAPAQFDPAALFGAGKRLAGVTVGSREMAIDLVRFVGGKRLHPVIDRVFAFEDTPAAYAYLAGGQHVGKIVISLQ